ncbi:MAG: UDP-N-acetylglucosamine 2-epimerase (non-hydrolyzing) [Planctomycetota bacterium]
MHVVGTRPNFVKIASILRACIKETGVESVLVHTGQHYSDNMSRSFFVDLEIPLPDINLEVGSGSHAQQTGEIMKRFEPVVLECKPDAVLVVGDVNSTIACALVACKLGVRTIHVEAGLRSFDRTMPEEINRVLTDRISDILFVTEPSGVENLKNEGIDGDKVHLVGNVMIDTLEMHKRKADKSDILTRLNLAQGKFCVVTLHRPSNVDECQAFRRILNALVKIQNDIQIVFPVHPRTLKQFESIGLVRERGDFSNIMLTESLGYLDFLKLMSESRIVITDSGGVQEETTVLGIPCLTVRENTERPITITEGTNMLVGTDTDRILIGFLESLRRERTYSRPHLWDGKASERIVRILLDVLCNSQIKDKGVV